MQQSRKCRRGWCYKIAVFPPGFGFLLPMRDRPGTMETAGKGQGRFWEGGFCRFCVNGAARLWQLAVALNHNVLMIAFFLCRFGLVTNLRSYCSPPCAGLSSPFIKRAGFVNVTARE